MRCLLKSVNETHPDIEISSANTFVGRSRETQIADTLVSKLHIKMRADFDKKCVILELLGVNPSTLNGQTIRKNGEHCAKNGDIIEMIPSKYPYKVYFENDATLEQKSSKMNEMKRKRSTDDQMSTSSKRMKWQIDAVLDATKAPGPWESYNGGQLLVYTSADCKSSAKIASYDMDGTLINTRSGKVFPTNVDDWKLASGAVSTTIKAKHNDGFKIVIFTNQSGISSQKTKVPDMKKKIQDIIKVLAVPVQAFVATGDSWFRKPLPGMWQVLCEHKNDGIPIDMDQSFYVGDAAGRPDNKIMKKKRDHSSADRLMAMNIGLKFYTNDEHFAKAAPQNWIRPEFDPKEYLNRPVQLFSNPKQQIVSNDLEVILMVGAPGTGKSQFCREHFEPNNYEIVCRDVIGTWQKCVNRVNDCLQTGRKVVVDNTNGDRESRLRYTNAAKKHKVPCRCFVMTTSFKHAEHNIAFRELTDKKHSKINKIVLHSYKKNYQEPELGEGFTEIVRINFVPNFTDEREKSLYEMYLLS